MCDCGGTLVDIRHIPHEGYPLEPGTMYWAYLHEEGTIQIKVWLHLDTNTQCNRCYAIEDWRLGAPIVWVSPILQAYDQKQVAKFVMLKLASKNTVLVPDLEQRFVELMDE